ncbi:MAG: histidine--tRNA ligase [Firmicutes bacterium]|nr:histidine--tRNA ligase [Bacillota bacterium]
MLTQLPRGTKDIYGPEAAAWRAVEDVIRGICRDFCLKEIRTPIFEHTELFTRSAGDASDVVQKEMYTFTDKGGRSLSLRPEGTAGAARAFVEHNMRSDGLPVKLFYIGPNFRYEKPAAGRWRQHHQFGAEIFGACGPEADAEVISVAFELLRRLGVADQAELRINSLGGKECRAAYNGRLDAFIVGNKNSLCETCRERAVKNPLRVLDCKDEKCRALLKAAPEPADSLGPECRGHFEGLLSLLGLMKIDFTVDPRLVRGFDYYTRTVFEFIDKKTGLALPAGGRYDGLIEECGGEPAGGVGFGSGMERLMMVLEREGKLPAAEAGPRVYVGSVGEKGFALSREATLGLRRAGIPAEWDIMGRSVKAQMKHADKLGAEFSLILGDDEAESGRAALRNMRTGEKEEVEIDRLAEAIGGRPCQS